MARVRVMQRSQKGQMEEVDVEPQVMNQGLAELIGTQSDPVVFEVERGAIRRYAQAIEDPNPLYNDAEYAKKSKYGELICPSGFWGQRVEPASLAASLFSRVREISGRATGMDNGGEIEFMLPVRAGDILTSVTKVADMYEEIGRSGNRLLLCIFETTHINQNGDTVAKSQQRAMYT